MSTDLCQTVTIFAYIVDYSLFVIPGGCTEFAHGPYAYQKHSCDWPMALCCWLPPPGLGMMLSTTPYYIHPHL